MQQQKYTPNWKKQQIFFKIVVVIILLISVGIFIAKMEKTPKESELNSPPPAQEFKPEDSATENTPATSDAPTEMQPESTPQTPDGQIEEPQQPETKEEPSASED